MAIVYLGGYSLALSVLAFSPYIESKIKKLKL